ncbi:MAG: (Fe-S)-binding protein [Promethearchaeota archaeon]|jgi:heterodisulfide reductase subunit D
MSKEKIKDIEKVVTTGPPGSDFFAPDQENLLEPITNLKEKDTFERCVHCGYCRHVCRVYNTTLSEKDYAGGRNRILKSLSKNNIEFDKEGIVDSIYRCMLCGNCRTVCPVGIDTLEVFQTYRRTAVRKGVMPEKLDALRNSIKEKGNPFMESGTDRFNWCAGNACNEGSIAYERGKELYSKIQAGTFKPEDSSNLVGYFIGCTSAYRNNELSSATSRVLDKMGVEFIVFPEEKCCGSVLFRTGVEDDALEYVKYNVDMIRELGIKELVFSCAGCFSTFTTEYTKFTKGDLGFNLNHIVQFIPRIAKEKGLKIRYKQRTKENPLIVTYHDPCHLGRYCEVYDDPRELINMIEGLKLIEMKHNKEMSWCCGAGGGVRALYGEISSDIANNRIDETVACWEEINADRLKEALETKAETLLSACVFCKNNLAKAVDDANSELPVMDITQILEDCEFYK